MTKRQDGVKMKIQYDKHYSMTRRGCGTNLAVRAANGDIGVRIVVRFRDEIEDEQRVAVILAAL